jgi:tetratricopeptide (TPR) repeat protein
MITLKNLTALFSLVILVSLSGCQSGGQENVDQDASVSKDIPVTTNSKEAETAFRKGLDVWDLGNSQDAHKHFKDAMEKDPELAMAILFEGITSGSSEGFGKGLVMAKSKLEGASDFEKQMVDYVETFANGDAVAQLAIAKKMAAEYPDIARCRLNLGNSFWGRNKIEMSRASFKKATEINPDWAPGYDALANSYLFAEPKDLTKAESYAVKLVEMVENNPSAHITLGDCYRGQNKLEKARDAYANAIKVGANDFQPYYKKGHANTFLGNFEEARSDFQKGREYDENKDVSFEAYTYLYAGETDKALDWMEGQLAQVESLGISAERLTDGKLDMINQCAWMAFHQGKTDKLAALKELMIPLSKEEAEGVGTDAAMIDHEASMLFWDALISAANGNSDVAMASLEKMKSTLDPINDSRKLEGYHFASGYNLLQNKDYDGAINQLEQANPDWVYNQYLLAKANEMAGNEEQANELYLKISQNNFNSVHNANIRNEVRAKVTPS